MLPRFLLFFLFLALGRSQKKFALPAALFENQVSAVFLGLEDSQTQVETLIPKFQGKTSRYTLKKEGENYAEIPTSPSSFLVLETDHKTSCDFIKKMVYLTRGSSQTPSFVVNIEENGPPGFMEECGCGLIQGIHYGENNFHEFSLYFDQNTIERLEKKETCGSALQGSKSFEHIFIVHRENDFLLPLIKEIQKPFISSLRSQKFLFSLKGINLIIPASKACLMIGEKKLKEEERALFLEAAYKSKTNGIILDFGAGIGTKYAKFSGKEGQKTRKVVAFEPIEEMAGLLMLHKEIYGWDQLEIIQAAVSSGYEKSLFIKNQETQKYEASKKETGNFENSFYVQTINMDEYLLEQNETVFAVFVDVNGFEYELLQESLFLGPKITQNGPLFFYVRFSKEITAWQSKKKSKLVESIGKKDLLVYKTNECSPLPSKDAKEKMSSNDLVLVSRQNQERFEREACPSIQKRHFEAKKIKEELFFSNDFGIRSLKTGALYFEKKLSVQEEEARSQISEITSLFELFVGIGLKDPYILAKAMTSKSCKQAILYDQSEPSKVMQEMAVLNDFDVRFTTKFPDIVKAIKSFKENSLIVLGDTKKKILNERVCAMQKEFKKKQTIVPGNLCIQKKEL